jgi:AcrR family transcriptional regulator
VIDERILSAAIELYAAEGWAAFTFESVARSAGVGKPGVYRRFGSREDLLTAALAELSWPAADDHGSLRADLEHWSATIMQWWSTSAGGAFLRWQTDLRFVPSLKSGYGVVLESRLTSVNDIIERAVDRGELSPDDDHTPLLEMVSGAVLTRVLAAPWSTPSKTSAKAYATTLVNRALLAEGLQSPVTAEA